MRTGLRFAGGLAVLLFLSSAAARASDAQLFFSTDKSGENVVTRVREGESLWIVVKDADQNLSCDDRDKVWTDVKVMDSKTGAHIVWKSYKDANGDAAGKKQGEPDYVPYKGHSPGASAGWLGGDYLEETGASSGTFVSSRPFQIGTRVAYDTDPRHGTHIVGPYEAGAGGAVTPLDFEWGGYLYGTPPQTPPSSLGDERVWVNAQGVFHLATPQDAFPGAAAAVASVAYLRPDSGQPSADWAYLLGRFEKMDTLVGLYVDPLDGGDVALAQAKIADDRATIAWSQEVYPYGNRAAQITVTDPDQNLNGSAIEYVPVFILVNPGSWDPVGNPASPDNPPGPDKRNPTDFCSLKRYGGVKDSAGELFGQAIVWYNIYDSGLKLSSFPGLSTNQPLVDGTYFIQYPVKGSKDAWGDDPVTTFSTASKNGITRVMFYAKETGPDTGVFQLNLNSIQRDLGFRSLSPRDVLVAYYVDPNDQDDFALAEAYIKEHVTSSVRFTDAERKDMAEYRMGRDPVYVEVVDANANVEACCPEKVVVEVCDPHEVDDTEWLVLDELTSNSPTFFSNSGMHLRAVWAAEGHGDAGGNGGYQLQVDNWKLEGFNEDTVYVRYNDVSYTDDADGILGLADRNSSTACPPRIKEVRVANDVSLDLMTISDTEVFRGDECDLTFLDREGKPVTDYVTSDCVFIQVTDPDQNEDDYRRERVAAYWDARPGDEGQNLPFGPMALRALGCNGEVGTDTHPVNDLLGQTNVMDAGPVGQQATLPHLYVLNPRNGRWAAVDLYETETTSGTFVSVACVPLVSQYSCVPSLGALPGDTILATYQDPSNHSDVAWTAIKVARGGDTHAGVGSTLSFTDAAGNPVTRYADTDTVYVKVEDRTHAGDPAIPGAVMIGTRLYDLGALASGETSLFMTAGIALAELGVHAGQTITAVYTDPEDLADTSTATVSVVASVLQVDTFYARPNPFGAETTFTFLGSGIPTTFSVTVYSPSGQRLWSRTEHDRADVTWDGRDDRGNLLASGPYVYVAVLSGKDSTLAPFKGTVFIDR